jgi:cell division protein ZipA
MDSGLLRWILLLIGLLIVGFIAWDMHRRKKAKEQQSDDYSQQTFEELLEQRDSAGFDITGVGLTRIIGEEDFVMNEPLSAAKDNDQDLVIDDLSTNLDEHQPEQPVAEKQPKASVNTNPELVVSISIVARSEQGFNGEKLLHEMLSLGLRFGDMDIFHRHKHASGQGQVQFSLANALQPGTFNLDDMSSFATRAVTLFMILPGPKHPTRAYKLMLETAQKLAKELNGQLLDSNRSMLTQQTIAHLHEQIQEFERRQLTSSHG